MGSRSWCEWRVELFNIRIILGLNTPFLFPFHNGNEKFETDCKRSGGYIRTLIKRQRLPWTELLETAVYLLDS